jgi:hypothetical protein
MMRRSTHDLYSRWPNTAAAPMTRIEGIGGQDAGRALGTLAA